YATLRAPTARPGCYGTEPRRHKRKVRAERNATPTTACGAIAIPVRRCLQEIKPSLQQAYIDEFFCVGARGRLASLIETCEPNAPAPLAWMGDLWPASRIDEPMPGPTPPGAPETYAVLVGLGMRTHDPAATKFLCGIRCWH